MHRVISGDTSMGVDLGSPQPISRSIVGLCIDLYLVLHLGLASHK